MTTIHLDAGEPAETPAPASGWLRLQADLERTFVGQPDLQARVRDVIAWLAQNADSRRERRAT
jgi:hypothetical protein